MPVLLNVKKKNLFIYILTYHLFIVVELLVLVGFIGVFVFGIYAKKVPPNPNFSKLKKNALASTKILALDGTLIAKISSQQREWMSLNQIPQKLKEAVVAVEDSRFYQHGAVDFIGLARAIIKNIKEGRIAQGGSTLTQQVAKFYLGQERTFDRKIKEGILALRLERNLSKDQILELYLNLTFLGKRSFGIKAAAKNYFGKKPNQLTLAEMAMLAGMAQAPTRYAPDKNPKVAKLRRTHVLQSMKKHRYITEQEYLSAVNEPFNVVQNKDYYSLRAPYFTEHIRKKLINVFGKTQFESGGLKVETTIDPASQYFARKAVSDLLFWEDKRQGWRGPEAILKDEISKRNFRGKTELYYHNKATIKDKLYLALVEKVAKYGANITVAGQNAYIPLKYMKWAYRASKYTGITDKHISNAKKALKSGYVVWVKYIKTVNGILHYKLEQIPRVQSAVFAMDHRSGYVIAMIGGSDFDLTKFNRTTQACRQPGSTYKAIYYSLALNKGWSYNKKFSDIPYSIVDPATGKRWKITNYSYGDSHNLSSQAINKIQNYKVTLQSALVWSRNIPSVTIFQALGAKQVAKWAKRFGFTTPIISDKGLALGASCVKISELTSAFSVFAENGKLIHPIYIKKITTSEGKVILDNKVAYDPSLTLEDRILRITETISKKPNIAIPPKAAYRTSYLLRKVISDGHADALRKTNIIAAGKTGTASKTMDTWFVGYTSNLIATFWLGDDKYERPLGYKDAAHMTTLPSWARFMYDAARFHPMKEIPWKNLDGTIKNKTIIPGNTGEKPILKPPKKNLPVAR